jgi:hypothetical protein
VIEKNSGDYKDAHEQPQPVAARAVRFMANA